MVLNDNASEGRSLSIRKNNRKNTSTTCTTTSTSRRTRSTTKTTSNILKRKSHYYTQINTSAIFAKNFMFNLSINDNINVLEHVQQGYKRKTPWNKYDSKIITQPKNNNLDYMIDPTFGNIKRLFVQSFTVGNDSTRNSYVKY